MLFNSFTSLLLVYFYFYCFQRGRDSLLLFFFTSPFISYSKCACFSFTDIISAHALYTHSSSLLISYHYSDDRYENYEHKEIKGQLVHL